MSLKERIAAIQQREERERARATSPPPLLAGQHDPHPASAASSSSLPPSAAAGALRAKIAQFESKGGVPIPRGSFGLPMPEQKATPRAALGLYGNRMPPARLPSAALARPLEPFSTLAIPLDADPDADDDDDDDEPPSPRPRDDARPALSTTRGVPFSDLVRRARSPDLHAAAAAAPKEPKSTVPARGTDFSTALERARRAEADGQERRRSAQFTGGLTPQHTGTGAGGLTPQHTGGLTPQHTGGSGLGFGGGGLVPQNTGGGALASPPTSPFALYPPRSPRSPTRSLDAASPGRPRSQFFPLEEEQPETGSDKRALVDMRGRAEDGRGEMLAADAKTEDVEVLRAASLPVEDAAVVENAQPPSPPPDTDTHTTSSVVAVEDASPPDTDAVPAASPDSFHAGLDPDTRPSELALGGSGGVSPGPASPESFHAGLDGDGDDEYDDFGDDGHGQLAPLPNLLHTHRFRAHLSTITERSAEPGSPPWDKSRFSMSTVDEARYSLGTAEEAQYGVYGEPGAVGDEDEAGDEDAGIAGVGAGARALQATMPSRYDAEEEDGAGGDATSPSPYRLSFLTDREYTPSLRSEPGSERGSVCEGERVEAEEDGERGGEVAEDAGAGAGNRQEGPSTPYSDDLQTPTMTMADLGLPQTPPVPSERNSMMSMHTRDSILSTPTRDSISSMSSAGVHIQTLTLRPASLSTLDSGSPSHIALAHRVPVVDGVAGVERGVAVFVPGSAIGEEEAPRTPDGDDRRLAESAVPPSRHPAHAQAARPTKTRDDEVLRTRRHAYTTGAPRPHTEYVPPAPDDDVDEFGTISFGSQSSFSAVVHGRVRENRTWNGKSGGGGAYARPRSPDEKRLPLPPTPLSPGYASGELAELLAETAALAQRLDKGELPAEALRRMSMRPPLPPQQLPALTGTVLKPQRSNGNQLGRSRSDRRPKTIRVKEDERPVASSSMSNLLGTGSSPTLLRSQSATAATVLISDTPPTPPPKSPSFGGTRYFSSLRRLASNSHSQGAARGSVSTSSELSSEDSMGLPTPPDDAGAMQPNSPMRDASLKSKKSAGSLRRGAAALAGKMFRSRSKSNSSTVSSDTSSPPSMPLPAMPSPPVLKLDPILFPVPPLQTSSSEEDTSITPTAKPLNSLSVAIPTKSKSSSSAHPPHLALSSGSAPQPLNLLPVPKSASESRHASWMSDSSVGTPIDKIFDAFPSVPQFPPPPQRRPLPSAEGSIGGASPLHSSGMSSPVGPVPLLPASPPGFNSDSSSSPTPTFTEPSFGAAASQNPGSYKRENILVRVAQTQRRIHPL